MLTHQTPGQTFKQVIARNGSSPINPIKWRHVPLLDDVHIGRKHQDDVPGLESSSESTEEKDIEDVDSVTDVMESLNGNVLESASSNTNTDDDDENHVCISVQDGEDDDKTLTAHEVGPLGPQYRFINGWTILIAQILLIVVNIVLIRIFATVQR